MSEAFSTSETCGRISVTLQAIPMGNDLLIALHGGDRSHIGAVAVSQPRSALKVGDVGASTSVITILGHREDQLARDVAHRIAGETGVIATVACGIHFDQINVREIKQVILLSERLTSRLIDWQQHTAVQQELSC
ncbi:MAG: hypothetical protein JXQ81_02840 [Desulfuromonadales bacterium]|nr:hypothetical protein [Desulfuromonadales bacterium]